MNDVYNFIKFLKFDYIDFLADVWKILGADLKDIDLEKFCKDNDDFIIEAIEYKLDSQNITGLISIFLRTYNKLDMIDFIISSTKKSRMEILMRIMERL